MLEDSVNNESTILNIITKLAVFLRSNQIIIDKISLPNDGRNTFSVKVQPFYSHEKIVTWNFSKITDNWYYENQYGKMQPIELGYPFRLPVDKVVFKKEISKAPAIRQSFSAKFRHYYKFPDLPIRLIKYLDFKIRNLIYIKSSLPKPTMLSLDLAKQGGVTFMPHLDINNNLSLNCIDHGGIYDFFLDGEGETWPDQTPEYGSEYAAYIFYWLWKKTEDNSWLVAAQLAVQFSVLNIKPYACISFDSYEFKILPLAKLIQSIKKNSDQLLFPVEKLIKCLGLDWGSYDPVNVQAMRILNLAILKELWIDYSDEKYNHCLRLVRRNQTTQGLIMDNRGGSKIKNADLTYHQFALACLIFAARYKKDIQLHKIISDALNFTRGIALPDGHVSYYGRGANNIYHLLCYAFAESQVGDSRNQEIFKIIRLVESFVDAKHGLPTALNRYQSTRMGWNHSAIPYNGQVAFFLCEIFDCFAKRPANDPVNILAPLVIQSKPLDYVKIGNSNLDVVVGRGSDISEWSGGAHSVGMGGLVAVIVNGCHISLANEFSILDQKWTGDLPYSRDRLDLRGNYFGNLIQNTNDSATLILPELEASYRIIGKELIVNYYLRSSAHKYESLGALSFKKDLLKDYKISQNKCVIAQNNGSTLLLIVDSPLRAEIICAPIKSNPFGTGMIFSIIYSGNKANIKNIKWRLSLV